MSDASKALSTRTTASYPWQRYWAPRDGLIDLGDGGFLVDPESEWGRYSPQKLYTLDNLQHYRALALLGEPGIGKSVTLKTEYDFLPPAAAGGPAVHRFVDLRSFSSDVLLHSRVFGNAEFLAWEGGNSDLVLYLDSLDEALLRIDTVAALLADEFVQHPTERLSVRIACRTFVWPHATLERAFRNIWDNEAVGVFELAPLRRRDVVDAARQRGIEPDGFIEAVENANAVSFAIKPLTLSLLFRLYERDGTLPTRRDLYAEGCLSLCEEQSDNRRAAGRLGRLNEKQRYRLASRVAAVTMFANRYAIWTDPATKDRPEEDVALSDFAVGSEAGADFQPFDATDANLREVLDTGLFSSRGPARIGWAHQSYAEFLAADYLVGSRVSPENVTKMLCHPNGGLIPQLSMVAAWAASREPELRRRLIEQEPFTLLRGDLLSWEPEDLAMLTGSLLTAFQEQTAHDFTWGTATEYRKLAHPGLAFQLRPFIVDKSRTVVARRAALMIARACNVTGLKAELLAVALDASDDAPIRAQAVAALDTCGDEATLCQLLPLAQGHLGPDPNLEIKGHALRLLWPEHLTSVQLFGLLTPPGDDGFVGAYVTFVTRHLPASLVGADFVPALHWISSYARSASFTGPIQPRHMVDAIFANAWAYADAPEVMEAIICYVNIVFRQFHHLFMSATQHEEEKFKEQLRATPDRRRQFLLAVLAGETLERHDGYLYQQAGFLQRNDLEWLLSICPVGSTPIGGIDAESLCALISALFNPYEEADLQLVYDIAMAWSPLHERFRDFLDGVPLDSPDATQMRRHHQSMLQLKTETAPPLDPPPEERVRRDLDRFEAGDLDAWWHLNVNLTLKPTSTHWDDLQLRITSLPGWVAANTETRERIVRAATKFLEDGTPMVQTWLGTNSYKISDRSAYRAFFLLRELDPRSYSRLSDEIWQKWAPVIIAVQKDMGGEDGEAHEAILSDAVRKGSRQAVATVQRLIRIERRRSRRQPENSGGTPFFFLRELRGAWDVPDLQNVLFAELGNRNNSVVQFESLLDPLLQSRFGPAQVLAKRMLRAPGRTTEARRPYILGAATGLMLTDARESWGAIWRWIEADPQFGSELFQKSRHSFSDDAPFYSELDDVQAGQLYLWLEQHFPVSSDGRHERAGRASWVGPVQMIGLLRDGVLRNLVARGTEDSVAALRQVVLRLPDRTWLVYQLLEAERAMRIKTWLPLAPSEVIAITASAEVVLIQSPRQLEEILVGALRKYERRLHGEQTPIRGLWDRQGNKNDIWRPVEEDALSNDVRLFLKAELGDSGVVLNREVEIGRVPGAPIGSRTDIKVDAVSKIPGKEQYNVITAVIEAKGCWNAELMTAMQTQLVEDYMVRLAAPVGIYLVGWFDKAKWDLTDRRRRRTLDLPHADAQQMLDTQAALQPAPFIVRAVVLDCHAP